MARSTYLGQGFALGIAGAARLRLRLGFGDARTEPGAVLAIPIPISPYFQERKEDEAWEKERYDRVPILGPITSGGPPVALDPPSDDEVMRALEKARPVEGGVPLLYERNRNNVRIVKYKIADYVDPPRVYPLIGPAQQHHAHYKCIDLLRRRPPHRLAGAVHDSGRRCRRSDLHRP